MLDYCTAFWAPSERHKSEGNAKVELVKQFQYFRIAVLIKENISCILAHPRSSGGQSGKTA